MRRITRTVRSPVGGAVAESITVTDNRTGEVVEIPITDGGVSADEFRKLLPGIWFYDPAFMTTALTASSITYLDGDAGILRYRGYPIEQLAAAVDLPRGGLPADPRRAADRHRARGLDGRDPLPHLHPRELPQAVRGRLPLRRPSHGHARVGHRRPVDLLPRGQGDRGPGDPTPADRPADRQGADSGRGMPPLQRRHAVRVPRQLADLHRELPVDDVEAWPSPATSPTRS